MTGEPYIPRTIRVHLGAPDANAPTVTVPFPDYIKNVASSEIYPTWPENAIRANIYAQISYALNRYYTEWYPSRGYDFDITNSTAYDQSYVYGRDIFENIDRIVDEIFNSYIRRQGNVEPLFAQYCNGTTTKCPGLSQWGTVSLAEQGLSPYQILQRYFGENIDLVQDAPVRTGTPSYPGTLLRLGDSGNDVQTVQIQLNRVSRNYPAIPKINDPRGVFDDSTRQAVEAFQRLFNLSVDGIVGPATWYRLAYLYTAVKRLSELDSEGISLSESARQYPGVLQMGDTGVGVDWLQYYLAVAGAYYRFLPPLTPSGVFDEATRDAVIAFQTIYGLTPDGLVGRQTWQQLTDVYDGIRDSGDLEGGVPLFPGTLLLQGSMGEDVRLLQQYLNRIARSYDAVPSVPENGLFGAQTVNAVRAYQQFFGLPVTGVVNLSTWNSIAGLYSDLVVGSARRPGQSPGVAVG